MQRTFQRKLSTVFNLEREPLELDELPWDPKGLPAPVPLHSDSHVAAHSFSGWPLLLLFITIILGFAVMVETYGEMVMQTYIARASA